ncbi:hypothetical protein C2G38_2151878 [Gigaspora rosea]|uniref:Uncharacterized protein n=1 Tax=Gigaspora rosea TaxID=44941 RepID=A0A397W9F4_9GLOM|nr:hypothetical protein C2G38_2151878 [Gigaspora rosea]
MSYRVSSELSYVNAPGGSLKIGKSLNLFSGLIVEVIEDEGSTESIGKYLADLYKTASDASTNTAKAIQYKIESWYNYAYKFKNRVKELIKTVVKEK